MQENLLPLAFAAIPLIVMNVGCTAVNLSTPVSTRSIESATIAAPTVASAPASLAPEPSGPITLTVWTIEDFSPSSNARGLVWRDQFAAFRSANPDISPNIILKKADGKGGMLDSLMSTRGAAPTLLPDVAIVSASDAWVLSEAKILQPLNGVLSNDLANGLYPFANQYSVVNQWISIPFAADVQHLVYNQAAVSPVPRTWDDLARQKSTILVPLGNDDGFLLQYLAFGASINNFDTTAATQIFGFIKRGREIGFLSDSALTVSSADDAWNAFESSQVAMAQISASRYWSGRDRLPGTLNPAFAPVPTRDGRTASLARAWAFVIPTSDPRKRGAAAALIQWLMHPDRLTPFLRAAYWLPTRRGMIGAMIESREYSAFLNDLLERATPVPSSVQYPKRADAWRAAISSVWRGQMTPEEAAKNVAAR